MIYLCSFLRSTDGLFGRLFLIAFFLWIGALPFLDPESLHVPFWLLPTVSAIVIFFSLTSRRLYYCPDNEEVFSRTLWLGIPVWRSRTIRLKDISHLVLKSEHDDEKWHDFSVELHHQEFPCGELGKSQSIAIMTRRGEAGAVIEEARWVAKELGVEMHDQRTKISPVS